jgi:hypothetical protein
MYKRLNMCKVYGRIYMYKRLNMYTVYAWGPDRREGYGWVSGMVGWVGVGIDGLVECVDVGMGGFINIT